MSEYQYYEFQAVDRPLSHEETAELGEISTRAEITTRSFTNTYNYGNFRGDPNKMMEDYFDAHVYVTNWGSYHFMLRLPSGTIDETMLGNYTVDQDFYDCDSEFVHWTTEQHTIIAWYRNDEAGEGWMEGEEWMPQLLPIRSELEKGDYRSLYLGWLAAVDPELVDEDTIEPPVPPGLKSLTAAQQALAEFLDIDEDLLGVAAQASENYVEQIEDATAITAWLELMSDGEAKRLLLRVLKGEPIPVQAELRRRFRQSQKKDAPASSVPQRLVNHLFELTQQAEASRVEWEAAERAREQEKQARERRNYLSGLAPRFPELWNRMDELADRKIASAYDQVTQLLSDLADAYAQAEQIDVFRQRLQEFVTKHTRKTALIRRIREARLWP